MTNRIIYLVPGFFGFSRLGAINYFNGVSDALRVGLDEKGVDGTIVECETQPTGSITHQANRLIDEVEKSGGLDAEELHFIGHSTGGLNVRLLISPGVNVRDGRIEKQIGERTRSVITVASPHYGTPLANFFTSVHGRNILQLITLLATSKKGRHTVFLVSRILSMIAKLDDSFRKNTTFLDELSNKLLDKLTLDPTDPIWKFLREISSDQGAIIQLTPEGAHLLNAAATDRPSVMYHYLMTVAPPPGVTNQLARTSIDRALLYMLFSLLYNITAREHRHYPYPDIDYEMCDKYVQELRVNIDHRANDGVVPTLSQAWGNPLGCILADHLDVVGQHYHADEPLKDWLPSGTLFDATRFASVWRTIAGAIATSSS